jgi:hypothetical protein
MKIIITIKSQRCWRRFAFSMVEAMVSFGIMGITFIGLFAGMGWGFTMLQWTRENARATQVMLDKMEQFRLFNWDQITTNGLPSSFVTPYYEGITSSSGFCYTGTVAIASSPMTAAYAQNLRLVTIGINWKSGGLSHSRQIQTLIGKNGLQKYLY